jgi:hypothetical protein
VAKKCIAFLLLALQILNPVNAQAKELVFDGITPQSDATIPIKIAINNDYGFGFIAGETRELVEIDIIANFAITSGTVSAYVYQNSSNGNAGTGTYIGTLVQSEDASTYGSLSNAYLLKMKGRTSLITGLKYWVFFRYANYAGSGADFWGTVTPTVVGSWAIIGSGGNYQLILNTNNFSYTSYPIARLYLSTPTTISVALSPGGSSATYRRSSNLRANVNSDGPVTFYANGKKIGGCISIQSTSGVALCPWKPSFRGAVQVKARVVPRDSENYDPAISTATTINVDNRTNRR